MASISGTVYEMKHYKVGNVEHDEMANPIGGVKVTLDDKYVTYTSSFLNVGEYSFSNISEGTHTLKFEKQGYHTETVTFNTAETKRYNIGLNTEEYYQEMENYQEIDHVRIYSNRAVFYTGPNTTVTEWITRDQVLKLIDLKKKYNDAVASYKSGRFEERAKFLFSKGLSSDPIAEGLYSLQRCLVGKVKWVKENIGTAEWKGAGAGGTTLSSPAYLWFPLMLHFEPYDYWPNGISSIETEHGGALSFQDAIDYINALKDCITSMEAKYNELNQKIEKIKKYGNIFLDTYNKFTYGISGGTGYGSGWASAISEYWDFLSSDEQYTISSLTTERDFKATLPKYSGAQMFTIYRFFVYRGMDNVLKTVNYDKPFLNDESNLDNIINTFESNGTMTPFQGSNLDQFVQTEKFLESCVKDILNKLESKAYADLQKQINDFYSSGGKKYTFTIHVTDASGKPIQGAAVVLTLDSYFRPLVGDVFTNHVTRTNAYKYLFGTLPPSVALAQTYITWKRENAGQGVLWATTDSNGNANVTIYTKEPRAVLDVFANESLVPITGPGPGPIVAKNQVYEEFNFNFTNRNITLQTTAPTGTIGTNVPITSSVTTNVSTTTTTTAKGTVSTPIQQETKPTPSPPAPVQQQIQPVKITTPTAPTITQTTTVPTTTVTQPQPQPVTTTTTTIRAQVPAQPQQISDNTLEKLGFGALALLGLYFLLKGGSKKDE
ncbi:MAG: carboxypeptidase-like regulatory domain-containing protein [Nitrososphaeria archaeon]